MRSNQLCVAFMTVLLISEAKAVEVGKPSKTSIGAAARRALAARDYDPSVRNPDWLAEQFLGPDERKIMAGDRLSRIWTAIIARRSRNRSPAPA